ncbi:hypothetical protein [Rubellicoccus peritrichatus]|uniref:Uncharacterized protein n=1 Tax=Rubellicoccus peritrichatus TaxID=3080537 RepID=A0AAQ3QXE3_9BACT|nr:hypothetical protein [Puniceicoccus sp. CR14]WOO43593.1 hypothetical protein RZN69_10885 [Puniceicoccus sp. CR14]
MKLFSLVTLIGLSVLPCSAAESTGLWIGSVILDRVSEITPSNDTISQTPTPVADPMAIRIIIFVDDDGNASLLKWATLMNYQTTPGDSSDLSEIIIIDTDDFYESGVIGYTSDGNRLIGRRFETVFYDWSDDGEFELTGTVGSDDLTGTFQLPATHASNPFYHRYHNMHQDGREITRTVTISNLGDVSENEFNLFDQLSGDYEEVINGLANDDAGSSVTTNSIIIQGEITLVRVSEASSLGLPN